jgi:hypothetical protein
LVMLKFSSDHVIPNVMQIYMQFAILKWLSYKYFIIDIVDQINNYAFFGDAKIQGSPIP